MHMQRPDAACVLNTKPPLFNIWQMIFHVTVQEISLLTRQQCTFYLSPVTLHVNVL